MCPDVEIDSDCLSHPFGFSFPILRNQASEDDTISGSTFSCVKTFHQRSQYFNPSFPAVISVFLTFLLFDFLNSLNLDPPTTVYHMLSHPLPVSWTFWAVGTDSKAYDVNPLPSFSTVEDFWGWWELIPGVNEMKHGSIALFKSGLTPAWENEANKTRVRLSPTAQELLPLWEFLVLKLVGGTLEEDLPTDSICGIYCTANPYIEIWYGKAPPDVNGLGQLLRDNALYSRHPCLKPFRR
jgi:hypothetical protein